VRAPIAVVGADLCVRPYGDCDAMDVVFINKPVMRPNKPLIRPVNLR